MIAQYNYELGQIVAIEDMSKDFRKNAGEFFAMENDNYADIYRNIAVKLKVKAKEARERFDKKWPKE